MCRENTMKKSYLLYLFTYLMAGIMLLAGSVVYARGQVSGPDSTKNKTKITDTRSNKPSGVKVNVVPFKPNTDKTFGNTSSQPAKTVIKNVDTGEEKILNNVKVYPNPVSDLLNLSYRVKKDSNVTIKIMDVLGNEVITLLSERMSAGEQNNTFNIAYKLNSGFYFVRLVVGNETVIKRISIL